MSVSDEHSSLLYKPMLLPGAAGAGLEPLNLGKWVSSSTTGQALLTPRAVFTTLHFLGNLRMGPKKQECM